MQLPSDKTSRFSLRPPLSFALLLLVSFFAVSNTPTQAQAEKDFLYWGNLHGDIGRIATDDGEIRQITQQQQHSGLAVHAGADSLFFYRAKSGVNLGALYRTTLNGDDLQLIVPNVDDCEAIEIDFAQGKIYWAEQASDLVRRANFDGTQVETLISNAKATSAIGLDADGGRVYYGKNNQVFSANLDGSGETFISSLIPQDIEFFQGKVYISSSNEIQRCDPDGMNCVSLLSGVDVDALEIVDSKIYHRRDNENLWEMDLDGNNAAQLTFGIFLSSYFDIDAAGQHVYYGGDVAFRANFDGSGRIPIIAAIQGVHGITYDANQDRLLISDNGGSSVSSIGLATDVARPLFFDQDAAFQPRGIAYDSATDKVYWTVLRESPSLGSIFVVNGDGSGNGLTEIVSGLNKPHDIVIEPVTGKLYWTDSISGGSGTSAVIRRADLDGNNVEAVMVGLSDGIRGLAVDSADGKLYWADQFGGKIRRADLNGSNQETLVEGRNRPHDLALDFTAQRIYWTEGIGFDEDPTGAIGFASFDGSSPGTLVSGLSDGLRDLTFASHPDLIFADGFESGTTAAWSNVVP